MAEIIEILQNFPEREIKIVAEIDSICTCCPYNIDGKCQESDVSNDNIISMDLNVLKKLGITPGSVFKTGEIFKITNNKLKTYSDVKEICGDCKWSEKCLFYLKKYEFSANLISK